MTNGEDLPPAWMTDAEGGMSTDHHCRLCDARLTTECGDVCESCQSERYFTMG